MNSFIDNVINFVFVSFTCGEFEPESKLKPFEMNKAHIFMGPNIAPRRLVVAKTLGNHYRRDRL